MQFLSRIPDKLIGILLIIGGSILLFDRLGLATEIMHVIVLIGALCLIALGIYLSNIHMFIYRLLTKENSSQQPPDKM